MITGSENVQRNSQALMNNMSVKILYNLIQIIINKSNASIWL